jgi:hypothetical protein
MATEVSEKVQESLGGGINKGKNDNHILRGEPQQERKAHLNRRTSTKDSQEQFLLMSM